MPTMQFHHASPTESRTCEIQLWSHVDFNYSYWIQKRLFSGALEPRLIASGVRHKVANDIENGQRLYKHSPCFWKSTNIEEAKILEIRIPSTKSDMFYDWP